VGLQTAVAQTTLPSRRGSLSSVVGVTLSGAPPELTPAPTPVSPLQASQSKAPTPNERSKPRPDAPSVPARTEDVSQRRDVVRPKDDPRTKEGGRPEGVSQSKEVSQRKEVFQTGLLKIGGMEFIVDVDFPDPSHLEVEVWVTVTAGDGGRDGSRDGGWEVKSGNDEEQAKAKGECDNQRGRAGEAGLDDRGRFREGAQKRKRKSVTGSDSDSDSDSQRKGDYTRTKKEEGRENDRKIVQFFQREEVLKPVPRAPSNVVSSLAADQSEESAAKDLQSERVECTCGELFHRWVCKGHPDR